VLVYGIWPTSSTLPDLFDLADYDYAPLDGINSRSLPAPGRSEYWGPDYKNWNWRLYDIHDDPDLNYDRIIPGGPGRLVMNPDGTWKGVLPDGSSYNFGNFDWVAANRPWWDDPPGEGWYQIQLKHKITGPVKGAWIVYDVQPESWDLASSGWLGWDPWPGDVEGFPYGTPVSAEYVELAVGATREFTIPLPPVGGKYDWGVAAFRRGKHPSDFSWYPLP
jgi:hypothetical protein